MQMPSGRWGYWETPEYPERHQLRHGVDYIYTSTRGALKLARDSKNDRVMLSCEWFQTWHGIVTEAAAPPPAPAAKRARREVEVEAAGEGGAMSVDSSVYWLAAALWQRRLQRPNLGLHIVYIPMWSIATFHGIVKELMLAFFDDPQVLELLRVAQTPLDVHEVLDAIEVDVIAIVDQESSSTHSARSPCPTEYFPRKVTLVRASAPCLEVQQGLVNSCFGGTQPFSFPARMRPTESSRYLRLVIPRSKWFDPRQQKMLWEVTGGVPSYLNELGVRLTEAPNWEIRSHAQFEADTLQAWSQAKTKQVYDDIAQHYDCLQGKPAKDRLMGFLAVCIQDSPASITTDSCNVADLRHVEFANGHLRPTCPVAAVAILQFLQRYTAHSSPQNLVQFVGAINASLMLTASVDKASSPGAKLLRRVLVLTRLIARPNTEITASHLDGATPRPWRSRRLLAFNFDTVVFCDSLTALPSEPSQGSSKVLFVPSLISDCSADAMIVDSVNKRVIAIKVIDQESPLDYAQALTIFTSARCEAHKAMLSSINMRRGRWKDVLLWVVAKETSTTLRYPPSDRVCQYSVLADRMFTIRALTAVPLGHAPCV